MIDNFKDASKLFYFSEINHMYLTCKIYGRRLRIPRIYYIRSADQLRELEPEIKAICKLYCADAYLEVRAKEFRNTLVNMLSLLALHNLKGDLNKPIEDYAFESVNNTSSRMQRTTISVIHELDNSNYEYLFKSYYQGYYNYVVYKDELKEIKESSENINIKESDSILLFRTP